MSDQCAPDPSEHGFSMHRKHPVFTYRCLCGGVAYRGPHEAITELEAAVSRLLGEKREWEGRAIAAEAEVEHQIGHKEEYIAFLAAAEASLTALRSAVTQIEQEMRTIAIVAGQASVEIAIEEPKDATIAEILAAEAERATQWADALASLVNEHETEKENA